jgi:hypothetical protein
VYLLPIDDVVTRSGAYLRVEPPLNGQRKRIRFAKDYEIARVDCVAADGRSEVVSAQGGPVSVGDLPIAFRAW